MEVTKTDSVADALDWLCLHLPGDSFRVGLGRKPSRPKKQVSETKEEEAATPKEPALQTRASGAKIMTDEDVRLESRKYRITQRGFTTSEATLALARFGNSIEGEKVALAVLLAGLRRADESANDERSADQVVKDGVEEFKSLYGQSPEESDVSELGDGDLAASNLADSDVC